MMKRFHVICLKQAPMCVHSMNHRFLCKMALANEVENIYREREKVDMPRGKILFLLTKCNPKLHCDNSYDLWLVQTNVINIFAEFSCQANKIHQTVCLPFIMQRGAITSCSSTSSSSLSSSLMIQIFFLWLIVCEANFFFFFFHSEDGYVARKRLLDD